MASGDTIAAIATAHGRGGVAVIRVSGSDAWRVARQVACCRAEAFEGASSAGPRARYARFRNVSTGQVVDMGLLVLFKAPHSYTGEDVAEFQCHGGEVSPQRVLEACFAAGARLALRGEFTQRAFLNGKIDLDQAESVLALIDAKTARSADDALEGLNGRRRRESKRLYETALDLSTQLEHALDVSEDELPPEFFASLGAQIVQFASQVETALRKAHEGRLLRQGALVVLAGPPNAGKSSLMNALLEENRAIVSDVPGTTRDSIEEWLDLDGWPIRLVDTAGLRETDEAIEAEGVRRAEELIAKADVVMMLRSRDVEKLSAGNRTCRLPDHPTAQLINVTSKCDLGRGEGLNVSARTGEGLDELKAEILARLKAKLAASEACGAPSADTSALIEARSSLAEATAGWSPAVPAQFDLILVGNALRRTAERLGELVGARYSSDLLENLFSRFCVGK